MYKKVLMDALVSVVIPTYSGENVIERAVDSVLQQTYQSLEIIVVDDNSPDSPERKATEKVMLKYKDNDKVVYLKHEVNKNGAAARNTGIRYAHGSFVAFLDDDDWFLPYKLEKQYMFMKQHDEYEACYCLAQRGGKPIKTVPYEGDVTKELLLMKSKMFTPSLLFRKESLISIKGFDESYRRHQDYEILLRFFKAGFKMGCVKEILIELGKGGGNNSPTPEKLMELKKYFLTNFASSIDDVDNVEHGFKKKVIATHYGNVFLSYVLYHRYGEAISLAKKYFIYSPIDFSSAFVQRISGFFFRKCKKIFLG